MRFEKISIEQCRATRAIKRRFGVKDALDYLVGEKLRTFADAARHDTAFARELPRFLAAIWRVFNQYELAGLRCYAEAGRAQATPHTPLLLLTLRKRSDRLRPAHASCRVRRGPTAASALEASRLESVTVS